MATSSILRSCEAGLSSRGATQDRLLPAATPVDIQLGRPAEWGAATGSGN